MEQISARAALVPASDLGDGLTTTIPRSDIQAVLAAEEEPIELVLDVTRSSDGEAAATWNVSVAWERTDLEQLLAEAQGDQIVLTFDREALARATDDVEAHGLRETALILAVAATAAAGGAQAAAAEPGAMLGGATPIVQSASPEIPYLSQGQGVTAADLGSTALPRMTGRLHGPIGRAGGRQGPEIPASKWSGVTGCLGIAPALPRMTGRLHGPTRPRRQPGRARRSRISARVRV